MNLLGPVGGYIAGNLVRNMFSRKRKFDGGSSQKRKKGPGNKFFLVRGRKPSYAARQLRLGASSAPELKWIDYTANITSDNNFAGSASAALLNGISCGPDSYQRVGRQAHLKSIHVKMRTVLDTSVVQGGVRFVLVLDKMPTGGAIPAFSTVFSDRDNAGATTIDIASSLNLNYRDRFVVLRNHLIQIPNNTLVTGDINTAQDLTHDWYVRLSNHIMTFSGSTTSVGDITDGAIYLYIYNSNNAQATGRVQTSVCSRLRFTD